MSGRAIDGQGRAEPSGIGDELSLLMQFLEFHRATVAWKCSDVDDQRLRQKLPPSELSLAGLLNHLAFVEDSWFSHVVASAPLREPWVSMPWGRDPDAEFHQAHKLTGIGLRRRWGEACDRSRDVLDGLIAGGSHLETAYRRPGDSSPRSLRWILLHMIEEYARHNGHADLLREAVDGLTGE